jgi:hypothetical protein
MADSFCVSESFTTLTGCFSEAHEISETMEAIKRAPRKGAATAFIRRALRIRAGINHNVSPLNLNASRQAARDYIADGSGRFNRRNPNFSNETAVAQNQHLGIWLDSLPGAQIENNEVVGLVNRKDGATHSNFAAGDNATLFFLF